MSGEGQPKRRGRPPRLEPARPTGYRATDPIRRHLALTKGFLGLRSEQDVIDTAVRAFLEHLRASNPRYAAASEALDEEIRLGHGNVEPLRNRTAARSTKTDRDEAEESS